MVSDPGIQLEIVNVPTHVTEWIVTREIAKVLHSDDFGSFVEGKLLNFWVKLKKSEDGGTRNAGSGTLTLPVQKSGYRFLDFVRVEPIKIEGRKLRFYVSNRPPSDEWIQTLSKTRFVDPDLEEQHQNTLRALEGELRVDLMQFGVFYRETYPSKSRSFSIEWECDYRQSFASISFEYDHKLILLKLGSSLHDSVGHNVCIHFASIQRIGVGIYGRPYICFEMLTPPILEEIEFHRSLTGDNKIDNIKYKHRVGFLDEGHKKISAYAPHLRVELFNQPGSIDRFLKMCKEFGIADSIVVRFPPHLPLPAAKKGFFSDKRLHKLRKGFTPFPWPVTFQLEALLLNGLLNTEDLEALAPEVLSLLKKHSRGGPGFVAELLRYYHEALKIRKPTDSPIACFQEKLSNFKHFQSKPAQDICCCHVTFTPTRILLEGPYATQSNRVIRQYQGYEDHFIRVDFRDEDMLQYRWGREVDSTYFVDARVGDTLRTGFELAGRRFEFLAYSNSALREHSLWFMSPFQHPSKGWVDGTSIRDSLGNFKGDLSKQPSKRAARLAQAFTATDASAILRRDEWEEVEDLVCPNSPHLFTDGVGTISRDLARRIWHKRCEDRHITQPTVKSCAFQIRFLGYKGIVAVDDELDKTSNGIHMRLRKSMRKFTAKDDEIAPIEIAQVFGQPTIAYLNRALALVLEDLGVRKEAFLTLQHNAVASARTIDESIEKFEYIVSEHKMGTAFELGRLLGHLGSPHYQMELKSMDNSFFRKLRRVATNDILRGIKHGARIPIANSYVLVGVADEGPAYEKRGRKDIFCLNEGEIFACIQKSPTSEPEWLEGNASISRSPVTHVGDVQRVRLIGKPPDGVFCAFRNFRNVVVMPSRGDRPLASCLGGGDLDGDIFSVIYEETLLPTSLEEPATYESAGTLTLERECTVEDFCDFVAEYINSDVLGILTDRLLVIADQSNDGMRDEACKSLAALCSQAVDYPKQGIPVILDDSLPRALIRPRPDWCAAEVVSPRKTDYYESSRALGYMFRAITLEDPEGLPEPSPCTDPMSDPITLVLFEKIRYHLGASTYIQELPAEILDIFKHYQDEFNYICAIHTLSKEPETKLLEEEVVIGTILAKCSQKRWRSNRIFRMQHHVGTLVNDIKQALRDLAGFNSKVESRRIQLLELGWRAWNLSISKRKEFGAYSFGLLALMVIFECLDRLEHMSVLA